MGKLIDQNRRKRASREREGHRTAVIEGARKAFLTQPPDELTMESIDRTAKMLQGTASVHFGSLENLVIHLLREELEDWIQFLGNRVRESEPAIAAGDLAKILASSFPERQLLCRLLAIVPAMASRRTVDMGSLFDHETWRLRRFEEAGALLESRCSDLGPGDGPVLLRRAVHLAAGLEPLITRPTGFMLAMNDQDLAALYPEAEEELLTVLAAILARPPQS